jgi:PAS domain S-box-containing protein
VKERFRSSKVARRLMTATPRSEDWFRALLEGAPDAIIGVDGDGAIVLVNAETERLFGYTRAEIVGQPIEVLLPERLRQKHVADRDAYLARPTTRPMAAGKGLVGRRKDGTEVHVEISLSPVKTASEPLVMSVIRDVTDRKRAEERELAMLRALARIGESAAIMAHEIKNPITAINAALKAVADRLGVEDRVILDDLVQRMRRLEMMIRGTLSFVKPLFIERRHCNIGDVLDSAISDARAAFGAKPIVIERAIARGVTIDADPRLLRDVLTNVIVNAAEAMEQGGTIVVRAEGGRDGTMITVEDDGPGMPPSMRGRPIMPFVTSKKEGTGLGLSICRKIIEEHGGAFALADIAPHGTRVSIEIPSAEVRSRPRPPTP